MTILQVAADSPWWIKAGAETILLAHIGGGAVGLVSGTVAVIARKGGTAHRWSGTVFFGAMLAMSGVGAAVAPFLRDRVSTVAGVMTFYLVLTAWLTVKRDRPGWPETLGLAIALFVLAMGTIFVMMAQSDPHRTVDGAPPQAFYVFLTVGGIAALSDLRMIAAGGLKGTPRIARHLWRMCTALFVASGSFFLGQQKFLPQALHGSPLLFIPALAPLAVMAFWLIRIRIRRPLRSAPVIA
ncbi:MAG TPA: hypothetical protein VG889_15720 [Rhizomicrobium sp.]|nr:hypothetical protein [Rhizomicrobium sp.]